LKLKLVTEVTIPTYDIIWVGKSSSCVTGMKYKPLSELRIVSRPDDEYITILTTKDRQEGFIISKEDFKQLINVLDVT